MELYQLKPIHKSKNTKRVGRGGKRGTFSGKGVKGQRSRAGRKFQPAVRELIKRYPKLRGYKLKSKAARRRIKLATFNLGVLEKRFNPGEIVNPEILLEKKIINKTKGRTPEIKILGKGEITKSLTIEGCLISESAKVKIEKVGGTVKYASETKPSKASKRTRSVL